MTRMKLGVVWLIGFVLGIVFGLLTFIGAGLGTYWILIGGLVIGFLTGFLLKEMGKSLGFGFLSAFLGFTVGGIIVVVALAPFLAAIPFLGGFLGILIVIVAVAFGVGAGILALVGPPSESWSGSGWPPRRSSRVPSPRRPPCEVRGDAQRGAAKPRQIPTARCTAVALPRTAKSTMNHSSGPNWRMPTPATRPPDGATSSWIRPPKNRSTRRSARPRTPP